MFLSIFFIVSLSKAGGWPSLAKMIGNWYQPSQFGRVWGLIATSSRIGTIIATLGLGFLLNLLSWQQILYVAGSIGATIVIVWFCIVREMPAEDQRPKPKESEEQEETDTKQHRDHPLYDKTLKFALFHFLKSKRVWLIFLAMMGLTIMTDFLGFIPIFLSETLNISAADAVMTASAFPIGSFIAVLLGGYVFDTLSTITLSKIIGLFLGIAVLCILVILELSLLELSLSGNILVIYICLFVFGFSVAPAYYLPMSIFSIQYGGPFSGILISILDLGGYSATAVFAIVAGNLADFMGWSMVLILLMVVGIMTLILTAWFLYNEASAENDLIDSGVTP
jgi:sugar phosphate permease